MGPTWPRAVVSMPDERRQRDEQVSDEDGFGAGLAFATFEAATSQFWWPHALTREVLAEAYGAELVKISRLWRPSVACSVTALASDW